MARRGSYVFTLARVAQMLGEPDDLLYDLACNNLDPEDGRLGVLGLGDEYTMAFTPRGVENLQELLVDIRKSR